MSNNSLLGLSIYSPSREIQTPGGVITVRGLGLDEIIALFRSRADEINDIYGQIVEKDGDSFKINAEKANGLGELLLIEAKNVAAEIITLGCGEYSDEAYFRAKSLPFPLALTILETIADLTFTAEIPPKKVFEIVMRALSAAVPALQSTLQP